MRTQIDQIFLCRETIVSNRKRLYDHYAGMFPTFEIFCQVMDQCTENYECLVIDNTSKSNEICNQVYWYKGDSHPPFKLGAPEFWQYHSNNYGENDDAEEEVDITQMQSKKKNFVPINVKKSY